MAPPLTGSSLIPHPPSHGVSANASKTKPDLSSTTDLTALIMASASEPARSRAFFWKPVDTLREHSFRDFGSGDLRYPQWSAERHLLTSPGRSIDPGVIASFVADLYRRYNVPRLELRSVALR